MNKRDKIIDKTVDDFVTELLQALDRQQTSRNSTRPNVFFSTPIWFLLAIFAIIVNIIMGAIIFWQKMRIDYLIIKIIGDYS